MQRLLDHRVASWAFGCVVNALVDEVAAALDMHDPMAAGKLGNHGDFSGRMLDAGMTVARAMRTADSGEAGERKKEDEEARDMAILRVVWGAAIVVRDESLRV